MLLTLILPSWCNIHAGWILSNSIYSLIIITFRVINCCCFVSTSHSNLCGRKKCLFHFKTHRGMVRFILRCPNKDKNSWDVTRWPCKLTQEIAEVNVQCENPTGFTQDGWGRVDDKFLKPYGWSPRCRYSWAFYVLHNAENVFSPETSSLAKINVFWPNQHDFCYAV